MPKNVIEGYRVTTIWDNGNKTHIEPKIINTDNYGLCVEIGITKIPTDTWPALRTKMNELFREIEKQND